jgi:hypothetical protein
MHPDKAGRCDRYRDFLVEFDSVDVCDRSTGAGDLALRVGDGGVCAPALGCCRGCCRFWCCCDGCRAVCCDHTGTGDERAGERARRKTVAAEERRRSTVAAHANKRSSVAAPPVQMRMRGETRADGGGGAEPRKSVFGSVFGAKEQEPASPKEKGKERPRASAVGAKPKEPESPARPRKSVFDALFGAKDKALDPPLLPAPAVQPKPRASVVGGLGPPAPRKSIFGSVFGAREKEEPASPKERDPARPRASVVSADKCPTCKKAVVSGDFVLALDAHWHPACFVCCQCRSQIKGSFSRCDGKPLCAECTQAANKRASVVGVREPAAPRASVVGGSLNPPRASVVANAASGPRASVSKPVIPPPPRGRNEPFTFDDLDHV